MAGSHSSYMHWPPFASGESERRRDRSYGSHLVSHPEKLGEMGLLDMDAISHKSVPIGRQKMFGIGTMTPVVG